MKITKFARSFFVFALLGSLVLASSACSPVVSQLPIANAAISDGILVIDSIEAFAGAYFVANPNPARAAAVAAAIAKARTSLDVALRIIDAAKSLDQKQTDAALADFRTAYTELADLVASIGIKSSGPLLHATSGGGLIVPTPLAFTLQISSP